MSCRVAVKDVVDSGSLLQESKPLKFNVFGEVAEQIVAMSAAEAKALQQQDEQRGDGSCRSLGARLADAVAKDRVLRALVFGRCKYDEDEEEYVVDAKIVRAEIVEAGAGGGDVAKRQRTE